MRIRSIQLKISLLAGICVVAASGALMGYSIISAANSKAFVGENLDTLTEGSTKNHLKTLALAQAALIKSPLDQAFDSARNMARMFEVSARDDKTASASGGARRTELNAILLNVLRDNPGFNGTYSAPGTECTRRSGPVVSRQAEFRFGCDRAFPALLDTKRRWQAGRPAAGRI